MDSVCLILNLLDVPDQLVGLLITCTVLVGTCVNNMLASAAYMKQVCPFTHCSSKDSDCSASVVGSSACLLFSLVILTSDEADEVALSQLDSTNSFCSTSTRHWMNCRSSQVPTQMLLGYFLVNLI